MGLAGRRRGAATASGGTCRRRPDPACPSCQARGARHGARDQAAADYPGESITIARAAAAMPPVPMLTIVAMTVLAVTAALVALIVYRTRAERAMLAAWQAAAP